MQRVFLVTYDPAWQEEFMVESSRIGIALEGLPAVIHHIGSTAIPGMRAKPIIDLLVVVVDLSLLDAKSHQLETLGYEVMGEFGIPGRRYFRRDNAAGHRTHQIHAFQTGSSQIERHLAFRNFMRHHRDYAIEYEALKARLAEKFPNDISGYSDGKDAFIKQMDAKAAVWSNESKA